MNFNHLYSGRQPVYKDFPERYVVDIFFVFCVFSCIELLMCIIVVVVILSVLANLAAAAISRPHFGINIPRFVSSVLLPRKVNKLPVQRKSVSTCFHISFVCQAWLRCSEGIVIVQSGTGTGNGWEWRGMLWI